MLLERSPAPLRIRGHDQLHSVGTPRRISGRGKPRDAIAVEVVLVGPTAPRDCLAINGSGMARDLGESGILGKLGVRAVIDVLPYGYVLG